MSKGTLTVTVIALIQLIAVLLLYDKVEDLERDISTAISGRPTSANQVGSEKKDIPDLLTGVSASLSEDRLRRVVQEVLHAELQELSLTDQATDTTAVVSPIDEAEAELQRDLVSQQIEYFSSVGRISDLEMQQLQIEISKLDDAYRKEALRQLTRALNSGNLEGRL